MRMLTFLSQSHFRNDIVAKISYPQRLKALNATTASIVRSLVLFVPIVAIDKEQPSKPLI